jgi:pimeloyl-ACP methyl ester carboxylesterase
MPNYWALFAQQAASELPQAPPAADRQHKRQISGSLQIGVGGCGGSGLWGRVANEIERARRATVKALFRAGDPAGKGKPARTAFVRANGGWFGAQQTAPDLPRDAVVLRKEDENRYVAALERNGFFGPDSWYMNAEANAAFAECAKANWRLTMPVLFMHGAYDYVCETIDSHLAEPMRTNCANLTEVTSSPCKFPRSGSLHSSP